MCDKLCLSQVGAEEAIAAAAAELADGFLANLTDTLTGEAEALAYLLEGHLLMVDAEAHLHDVLLTFVEHAQGTVDLSGKALVNVVINTVKDLDRPFFGSPQWAYEARDNVKKVNVAVKCKDGENTLRFYAISPGMILERLILVRDGVNLPYSYLGPRESYILHKG